MNLCFAGAPDIAAQILTGLLENSRHTVRRVYTRPDRPKGRGRKITPTPVKLTARKFAIPVRQPATPDALVRDDGLYDIDAFIVAAYGLILPASVLSRPRHGCINVHASLLPRWRGAAPIQRAIQAGDRQTGISIMLMDSGIDTGKVLLQKPCEIAGNDTAASLSRRLAALGGECLLEALDLLAAGAATPTAQEEGPATYAGRITRQEAEVDWHSGAEQVERHIRAFNPAPVAFSRLNNVTIRIWEARVLSTETAHRRPGEILSYSPEGLDVATGDRALRILVLQREGKRKQPIGEFYNGSRELFVRAPGD